MKKSLFAIAAVTAFAGAAQAQSSVTVYGLLDYGFQGSSQTAAGTSAVAAGTGGVPGAAQANVVTKTQSSGIQGSGQSTSRLGFRGTEDLGGGTSAFFTVEVALTTDNANPTAGGAGTTGPGAFGATSNTANRQTFIGLAQKGMGRASLGLQYTPIHNAVAATNAGGTNNVIGDVIHDRSGQTAVVYPGSGMSTNDSYTVRTSNALILNSENISGFNINGMVVSRGTTTTQTAATTGGVNTNSGYGLGVNYTWKRLLVTANYQQFNQEATSTTAMTVGYNGGGTNTGANAKDTQQYYGASYDFGILKAFVGYVNRKVQNNDNSSNYVTRTAQQIGVSAPITKTINVFASGGMGRLNSTGTNGPTADFTGYQLGSNYVLSKRTNLYAIYGAANTSNSNAGIYSATATANGNSSYNQSSYAIGMRHTF
jgi:predicted porin